jgi:tRNA dimethylallyltransferase
MTQRPLDYNGLGSKEQGPSDRCTKPTAIFLMGPTASGKTQLAVELVKALPYELISVDSVMVYRGMDIGTAKPDAQVQAIAPHRLIDFMDPAQPYSAARFRQDALREMADIVTNGKIPLLVGGTMLYYRALQHGLSRLPSADPFVRARIVAKAKTLGWKALYEQLRTVDPITAHHINPNDPQRLQRALEVYELTGVPLSTHYAREKPQSVPYHFMKFALISNDRSVLHRQIASRFNQMLEQGLIDEVSALHKRGDLSHDIPAMRAVGYRQIWDYLEGRTDYTTMVSNAISATRQLAKRQLTWLRAEQDVHRLIPSQYSLADLVSRINSCPTHLGY